MKKLISILLVLVLAVTMFAGCGKKSDTPDNEETSSSTKKKKKKKKVVYITKEPEASEEVTEEEEEEDYDYDFSVENEEDNDKVVEEIIKKLNLNTSTEHFTESMYVSVKSFGAVGDGKTDDTSAIQSAINSSTGKTVYLPAGTYLITKPIQISCDTNILGEASKSGVGGATVIKAGANLNEMFSGELFSSMRMSIGNLTFDGAASEGRYVTWAMNLYNCRSTKVFNCRFTNLSGGGINLDANGEGSLWVNHFNHLEFDNLDGYAIYAIVSDSFFSHITVDGGLGMVDWNYGGNCYSNVLVKNSNGNGLALSRENVREVGNITVRNCSFLNNARYGLYVACPENSPYGKQVTVSNSDFSGNGLGDINTSYSCAVTVTDCNLRSEKAIVATASNGVTFSSNTVKASGYINATDSAIYKDNNNFNSSTFKNKGYLADTDTLFDHYDKVFKLMSGVSDLQFVNLEDCGTPVEDDWSSVMKIAVAKVAKTGGVIYCPGSGYGIGDTVVIPSNVYIVGSGIYGLSTFHPLGSIDCMFVVRKAENSGFINCGFSSESASNKATYGGVYFMDSSDCFFYNCTLGTDSSGAMPYVVNIDAKSHNIQMDCCHLGAAAEGKAVVLCRGYDCVFQNLYATAGPSFILMNGKNNILQSNHFETCTTTHITIKGDEVLGHKIRSNYFDVNDCCVRMSFAKSYDSNITISCNTFRTDAREEDETTGLNPPELILSNASGVNIFANTFQQGFGILTTGIACSNSVFEGNVVCNSKNTLFSANTKSLGDGCIVEGNNNCH